MSGTLRSARELPDRLTCDVVIVGYGPVGIGCAALLAQHGLDVVVVERWPERYHLPRAGHFDGEIMRTVFQRLGVAKQIELVARSVLSVDTVTPDNQVLQSMTLRNDGSSWKSDYLSYQPEYEAIVDARAAELGVRVYMGVTARELEQTADAVRLSVSPGDAADGVTSVIEAAFVIGADGANSFVREAIGGVKRDLGFKRVDNLVVDFEHNDPDRDVPLLGEVRHIADPSRPTHVGRWGGGRWSRLEFALLDGETREVMESDDTVWGLIGKYGLTPEMGTVIRRVVYTFESSITEPWQNRRAFVMGDAAHTMPPYLGQGMCSGLRDAVNLSWKIAAVLAGQADMALLQTYESERRPHVVDLIGQACFIGEMMQVTDPEMVRQRDEMLRATQGMEMPFPRLGEGLLRKIGHANGTASDGRPSLQGRVIWNGQVDRLDDFLQPGWKLITRHAVPDASLSARQKAVLAALPMEIIHVSRGSGDHFIDLDAEYDLWFRTTGRKAFVVRPDSHVFGSVRTIEEVPGLIDDLAEALSNRGWRLLPAQ